MGSTNINILCKHTYIYIEMMWLHNQEDKKINTSYTFNTNIFFQYSFVFLYENKTNFRNSDYAF